LNLDVILASLAGQIAAAQLISWFYPRNILNDLRFGFSRYCQQAVLLDSLEDHFASFQPGVSFYPYQNTTVFCFDSCHLIVVRFAFHCQFLQAGTLDYVDRDIASQQPLLVVCFD